MQDYVTPITLAVLIAAHMACLASAVAIARTSTPTFPGWHLVGPSFLHWFGFVGSWAFAILISWVWLFVGSARLDADFQMNVALVLAVGFCAGAVYTGFQIVALRHMALRWQDRKVHWREYGREMTQEFARVVSIHKKFGGELQIRFWDQSSLMLDPYARNASEFIACVSDALDEKSSGVFK